MRYDTNKKISFIWFKPSLDVSSVFLSYIYFICFIYFPVVYFNFEETFFTCSSLPEYEKFFLITVVVKKAKKTLNVRHGMIVPLLFFLLNCKSKTDTEKKNASFYLFLKNCAKAFVESSVSHYVVFYTTLPYLFIHSSQFEFGIEIFSFHVVTYIASFDSRFETWKSDIIRPRYERFNACGGSCPSLPCLWHYITIPFHSLFSARV